MYSLGSAYADFADREKGSIAPGKLADLAVLSQDIFTVPLQALPGTTSVLTIVGGLLMRDALPKTVPWRGWHPIHESASAKRHTCVGSRVTCPHRPGTTTARP